jgi:PST family polysaccharide transporter
MTSPSAPDDYLRTDHLSASLRRRSVRGGTLVLVVQASQFVINLAATAVLARLLRPADFGLVSMATAVTGFLALFLDLGLGSAVIQRTTLTAAQVSALFWLNTALGVGVAVIAAGLAPALAWFYGAPPLVGVTLALAATFVLSGLAVQHAALLRRQMRFKAIAAVDVAALLAGVATAVIAALRGAGYWALVYQQLAQQATAAAGAWLACGWRPSAPAGGAGIGGLVRFGAGLTRFNVLNYLSRNVDNIVIGRFAGEAALGLYLKSYSLLMLPVDRVRGPASAVVIPALSHLQQDAVRFRRYFLRAITAVAAVGMPAVAFLFVFAEDAILLVLGPQWRASVLLFRILAPAAFVETVNTLGSWACLPRGETERLVKWQTIATGVMVLAFFAGARWGAPGVATAFTVATLALRGPALVYLLRGSPIAPGTVLRALSRPATAAIVAGAATAALRARAGDFGHVERLLAGAPVFAAIYVLAWFPLPGGRVALRELWRAVHDLRPAPPAARR